ncbi:MAG: amidohydrolase [Oscillospiraceae bacterium]|jgi:5-methylthioadenosine/S-adenosylhomocysteine deaminase|nr:amidohydrolase [Oscillospiraceae bacterium]
MDTLFSGVTAVTMDPARPVIRNAHIGVQGGKIAYVGAEPPPDPPAQVVSRGHLVVMPGLCNAHTHIAMAQLRGFADDYNLQEWLHGHVFPAEAKMTDESVYWGTMLGLLESVACGVVSVTDMYDHMDFVARAVRESGVKANLTRAVVCFDEGFNAAEDVRMRETRQLIRDWHGADGGRILVDASVHAEYTSFPAVWDAVAACAAEYGVGMNVHVSETRYEHEECKRKYGLTPAAALDRHGVFARRAVAAHCVWAEPEDIALFAERGVSVAHNPVSNAKLASGFAPVPAMLEAGVNVALGTDSVASNNNHDLFEEIKLCAVVHKALSGDATTLGASAALSLATEGGFKAQGRQRESGRIAVGFDADIIALDFDKPHLAPCANPVSHLVYAARGSDVWLTMVRGKILYKGGEYFTLDRERIMREAGKFASVFF